ncbi:hypothetical protein HDE78_003926 [Rhodanobacter sp. K2T2]|nr:hypothetical protein [Rhodanobacter sp. K2T2]
MVHRPRKNETISSPVAAWMQGWFGITPSEAREQANTGPVAELVREYLKERNHLIHSGESVATHPIVNTKL